MVGPPRSLSNSCSTHTRRSRDATCSSITSFSAPARAQAQGPSTRVRAQFGAAEHTHTGGQSAGGCVAGNSAPGTVTAGFGDLGTRESSQLRPYLGFSAQLLGQHPRHGAGQGVQHRRVLCSGIRRRARVPAYHSAPAPIPALAPTVGHPAALARLQVRYGPGRAARALAVLAQRKRVHRVAERGAAGTGHRPPVRGRLRGRGGDRVRGAEV